MKYIFLRNLALIAILVLANPAAAQVSSSARRAATPAAPSAPGSRAGRPPTDPRPSVEAVEARFREIDAEDLKLPPKRDYKIEMGEPQKVKLFRADPKLFENKFVATLVLARREQSQRPPNYSTGDPRDYSNFPLRKIAALDDPNNYVFPNQVDIRFSISPVFKELAKHCPAEQLPEPSLVTYLTSAECDRDVRGTFNDGLQMYSIYVPTVKEAEARVAAILRLHDCGVSRPLQQYFYAEGKKHLARALAGCDEFDKLTAEIYAEEEKLGKPSEVNADILSQLKAQKIMVAVELAGLDARVKACDGMLRDPKKLEASTIQSISDMKVKAEIERIGTKEKLDRIVSFIADGDKREAINGNVLNLNLRRGDIQRELSNVTNTNKAETYAYLVAFYSPRPVEGNKVLINPVEWTEQ